MNQPAKAQFDKSLLAAWTLLENLPPTVGRLIFQPMQLSDFLNAGSGLAETLQIVVFKMLPRGAQIEKVRTEINRGLLKKYGKITKLEIAKERKTISAVFELKGDAEPVQITLSNYQLIQADGKNPAFAPGTIEVSREWLNALLKTLVQKGVVPEQMEVKNLLHQAVVQAIL